MRRVIIAEKIRNRQLKEREEHIKRCTATDVIDAGDFNESAISENITNFMNETGLCDVFEILKQHVSMVENELIMC